MLGQRIELLEALPIFRGLSKKQFSRILDVAVKAYFEAGDNLVTRDNPGDTTFLILTGTARCLDFPGNPEASEQIGPGCLIGELAMLVETAYSLTVEAGTRVRALAFQRNAIRWVMERDPAIAARISDNLLVRLHSFANDLRRLDNFLAEIECAAPSMYGVQGLLEPPACVLQHAALPACLPDGKMAHYR